MRVPLATNAEVDPPIFPADLAARYRAKVDDLTLSAPEQATEASEVLRGLIDRIVIHPEGEAGHQIELIGELPALLSLASNDNTAAITAAESSLKLVAGKRNQLWRTTILLLASGRTGVR